MLGSSRFVSFYFLLLSRNRQHNSMGVEGSGTMVPAY
jgi:hypothetical protein